MAQNYQSLRDEAINDLKQYMDSLDPIKGTKLAYWIKDYARFLNQEQTFQSNELIRYKRGSIIKVHLGYRIGSEEGGLHYAVVMDRADSVNSPVLTVIPLTSVKPGVDLSRLHRAKVSLGNEVYTLLSSNFNAEIRSAKQHMKEVTDLISGLKNQEDIDALTNRLELVDKQIKYCEKMKREADRMKQGSIALVGQITTISKIRIFDPKHHNDALSKVRISPATLDLLDARIQELYGALPPKTE